MEEKREREEERERGGTSKREADERKNLFSFLSPEALYPRCDGNHLRSAVSDGLTDSVEKFGKCRKSERVRNFPFTTALQRRD